jgi:hypothetical protein
VAEQTGDKCAKIIPTSVGKLSSENFPTFYESGAAKETTGFSPWRFISLQKVCGKSPIFSNGVDLPEIIIYGIVK